MENLARQLKRGWTELNPSIRAALALVALVAAGCLVSEEFRKALLGL